MALREKTEKLLLGTDNENLVIKMSEELTTSDERKELRLAFVGQYSSGKSTIISALTGRKDIKIDANVATDIVSEYRWNNIVLMDTPGILWPKFEKEETGLNLAFTGAIRSEILDNAEIALRLIGELRKNYEKELFGRYKMEKIDGETDLEVMERIGKKRGCIVSGGEVDYDKVANIVLDEFRKGTIGRISLERP